MAQNGGINWQFGRDLEGSRRGHDCIYVPSQHFSGATQHSNCCSHIAMGWTIWGSNPGCDHIFVFPKMSRLALGPTQPPIQRTPMFFHRGSSGWGVNLTTCLHLVLRVKNEWSSTSSTLYAFVMCTWTSSFYLSWFKVVWLKYELWILNTSIEHYCCVSLYGKMWSCEYGGRMGGHNWSKQRITRVLKLLFCNTNVQTEQISGLIVPALTLVSLHLMAYLASLAPPFLWLCPVCTALFRQPLDRHSEDTAVCQFRTGNPTDSRTCTILPHWSRLQNPACRSADHLHTRPHLLTDIRLAQTVSYFS
jgi:hypothetical protein